MSSGPRTHERQSTFIVRSENGLPSGDWSAANVDLEDLVLTYMERAGGRHRPPHLYMTGEVR